MPPRATPAVLFMAAVLLFPSAAVPKQNDTSGNPRLEYHIVGVSLSTFASFDPYNPSAERKLKPGVVPIGKSGQYDVSAFLGQYGITFPRGSAAVYDPSGAIVLRNTPANNNAVGALFAGGEPEHMSEGLSVEISAYECTLAPGKDLLPWNEPALSTLQKLPANSLRLLERSSVVTKSGRRAVNIRVGNPAPEEPAKEDASHDQMHEFKPGETGCQLEVEPTAGPAEFIDVNIAYTLLVAIDGAVSPVSRVNFVTSFTAVDGCPLVVHAVAVPNQPGKFIVVVANVSRADSTNWQLPKPKYPLGASSAATPRKAPRFGLPPNMIFKVYRVPPGFLTTTDANGKRMNVTAKDYLKQSGITFPPGSDAFFDSKHGCLFIINTQEEMDLVDQITEVLNAAGPCQVRVDLSAYEFSLPKANAPNIEKFTFSDLENLPRELVRPLGSAFLVTKSGQRATSSLVLNPAPPDKAKNPRVDVLAGFQPGETGVMLVAEPVVGPDGTTVDAQTQFIIRTGMKNPGDTEKMDLNFENTFTAKDNTPMLIRVSRRPASTNPDENLEGKYIAIVARVYVSK
ncbi:MAG TPA: hypothetical protein VG733_03630 [Chthoniobacteraceae bacterium]|nr:hypothetical protein [Chthoniobacteraceae bacterium]